MAETTLAPPRSLAVPRRVGRLAEVFTGLLLLAGALWLRTQNLDAYVGSFDEGIRSEQLLLMSAGYRPFRDIFSSQGPLLLDLLYPFFVAFGQTLEAVRSGVVACSLVALGGAWWTARAIGGPAAGLAAIVILGLSPVFLEDSRLALAEVPTLAPALLALGAILAYCATGARRWLVVSASCCALALLIKPMVVHVGAALLVLLVASALARREDGRPLRSPLARVWERGLTGEGVRTRERGRLDRARRAAFDVVLYGAVVATICAIVIVALGPAQVWDNLGAYRTGAGHQSGVDLSPNLRLTANVMRRELPGFYLLAFVGLVLGLWRRPAPTLALALWGAAILAMFAVYGDLSDKHIVYLVPPIALLAAIGVGLGVDEVRRWLAVRFSAHVARTDVALLGPAQPSGLRAAPGSGDRQAPVPALQMLAAMLAVAGLFAYLWFLPDLYRAHRYLIREAPRVAAERRDRPTEREIVEIIRTQTPPDGWVLSDNPGAAFEAGRLVLPYLVDTSGTRVDAGSLTSPLARDQVERYRPSVIVTWPHRLGRLREFIAALPALGYRLERNYPSGWTVYVRE
ncbi:MAG: glycosyltransferase family 39 protein [Chloroflexi bacterium]|nr:glycosyltransferase family 39 protein [Chloroflexota bacterium]